MTKDNGEHLISAIVDEFNEMPGMKLTREQFCRLWQLERAEAEWAIASLLTLGFLRKDRDNRYGRAADSVT